MHRGVKTMIRIEAYRLGRARCRLGGALLCERRGRLWRGLGGGLRHEWRVVCLSLYVCMYVPVRMYVCMYVCMYVSSVYVVYTHVYMHVCMYVCVCVMGGVPYTAKISEGPQRVKNKNQSSTVRH